MNTVETKKSAPSDKPAPANESTSKRLEGLDVARFLAFVGMVIVNFTIVMGAEGGEGSVGGEGIASLLSGALEGRAAATFVVLAGVGLGLSNQRSVVQTISITLTRALFLLVLGLLNMLIFDADILHYYAFYFLFGALLLSSTTRTLIAIIFSLNIAFVVMIFILDYDAGWEWETYTYYGFWTAQGFIRNLFFNGWHPVIPWLGFLLFGLIVSRLELSERRIQNRLIGFGAVAMLSAEGLSMLIEPLLSGIDAQLSPLATTSPIPPMPLYTLAGMGASSVVIGSCLRFSELFRRCGLLVLVSPAGRQTLTLYIAHIVIGMGTLEALGMLGNQSAEAALIASFVFCTTAVIYAQLWARLFKRGPIEALMRRLAG